MVSSFHQALDHVGISHLDGQLSAAVKASRRQIDGPDDCAGMVSQKHLGVKLEMSECMDLNADVLHGAHAPYGLHELFLLKVVRRTGHQVNFYSATRSPH